MRFSEDDIPYLKFQLLFQKSEICVASFCRSIVSREMLDTRLNVLENLKLCQSNDLLIMDAI